MGEQIISLVLGCAAMAAAFGLFIFMLRTLTASSRKVYWRNIAILAAIGVVGATVISLLMPVLIPNYVETYKSLPPAPEPFAGMSYLQIGLILAAGIIWIVGGNLVMVRSARRAGRSWWQALNPLNPPFRDLTHRDVAGLGALAFVALGLATWALSMKDQLR